MALLLILTTWTLMGEAKFVVSVGFFVIFIFRHFLRSKKYPIGSVSVVDDVVVGVSTKTRDPR